MFKLDKALLLDYLTLFDLVLVIWNLDTAALKSLPLSNKPPPSNKSPLFRGRMLISLPSLLGPPLPLPYYYSSLIKLMIDCINHNCQTLCGLIWDGLFSNWKVRFDSDPRLHELQPSCTWAYPTPPPPALASLGLKYISPLGSVIEDLSYTVKPHLTATSVIRSLCHYGHSFFRLPSQTLFFL